MRLPETATPRFRWLRPAIGVGLIVLVVLVAYFPALRGEFVWDDTLLVDKNPLVTGELNISSVWFRADFPLTLTFFWLQWLAWGKSAAGYHAVNILLHAAGAILVWRALLRLAIPGALIGALIFAAHPVCAGTVAWVSEQKNTFSLTLFLLSAIWYLRFEGASVEGRVKARSLTGRHVAYSLSLIFFVLALLSKTSTVVLPVVLLLCVWWRRGRLTVRAVLYTVPFFVTALGFGLMTIWFQKQAMITGPIQSETFLARLALAAKAVWFYLGKAFFPANLSMIYPRWTVDVAQASSWLPLAGLLFVFLLGWRFRRGWGRPALFALAYFTITLFPALGFIDMTFLIVSRVSDHLQYLALIGVTALAGAGLSLWLKDLKIRCTVAALMVLLLSIQTVHRAGIMAKGEALWRDTLAKNPTASAAHNNLGCILAEEQKFDEAADHFLKAVETNPKNADAHRNAGEALALQGRVAEAETHFRAAVALKPNDVEMEKSLASALAAQDKNEEAILHLRAALGRKPDVTTRLQLAGVLRLARRLREAIDEYQRVLRVQPDSTEALNNMAWMLATSADPSLRNGPAAVKAAEEACRLTQTNEVVPIGTLSAAYAEAGRFDEAIAAAEKSLALATATGQGQLAGLSRQLLLHYRAGKPWHDLPGPGGK